MKLKWKMVDKFRTFTAESNGYHLSVVLGGVKGLPYWDISKDGDIIDACYYHSPTKCELTAKVQAERCLNKILEKAVG